MTKFLNIIFSPFRFIRDQLIRGLLKLRAKGQVASMRQAIEEADKIKKETGQKALVVYNRSTRQWEAIKKRQLKDAHKRRKASKDKSTGMKHGRTKEIEKKSVYVT